MLRAIMAQKMYNSLLSRSWQRLSQQYADYEKAEEMMLMHALDRSKPVQESYLLSFEMKQEVEKKIAANEKRLRELEDRNRELEAQYGRIHFG